MFPFSERLLYGTEQVYSESTAILRLTFITAVSLKKTTDLSLILINPSFTKESPAGRIITRRISHTVTEPLEKAWTNMRIRLTDCVQAVEVSSLMFT